MRESSSDSQTSIENLCQCEQYGEKLQVSSILSWIKQHTELQIKALGSQQKNMLYLIFEEFLKNLIVLYWGDKIYVLSSN